LSEVLHPISPHPERDTVTEQTAEVVETNEPDDVLLINALIRAHGDVDLAHEYAGVSIEHLMSRLPYFDPEYLASALRSAAMIQVFQTFTETKAVVLATLDTLNAPARAKFLLDLLTQFTALTAPKPQNTQPNSAGSNTNVINMFGDDDALRDTIRARIARVAPTIDIGSSA